MRIEKKALNKVNGYWDMKFFRNARTAFLNLLAAYRQEGEFTLFLPMYIGISPNEGSGIYDPVCELGIPHVFYRFGEHLEVDVECLEKQLQDVSGRKVFLSVHYFGYVDPAYQDIIRLLRKYEAFIVEDCAHALYTHLIDGSCGQGDCIFYSFHKMLPFGAGGGIATTWVESGWWKQICSENMEYGYYKYNLKQIADIRKRNAVRWEMLLEGDERFRILRPASLYHNQTPQSFPVLLDGFDRYQVYLELNRRGYGVISLYHTMIEPIQEIGEQNIMRISGTILNFPCHQDVGQHNIDEMHYVLVSMLQDKRFLLGK